MFPAVPNPLILRWFDGWCRRALRRHFARLHRFGDPLWLNRFSSDRPRLYVSNHPGFWDGIVVHHLLRTHLRQPALCMVDARQVAEHPFFRRVGAFSVDRDDSRDRVRALRYAIDQLRRTPARALVIFPQGEATSVEAPLRFEHGAARIARAVEGIEVIPLALRYDFWQEQRGEALLWIGEPVPLAGLGREQIAAGLERAVAGGLEVLRAASARQACGDILLWGRRSISDWKRLIRRRRGTGGRTDRPGA